MSGITSGIGLISGINTAQLIDQLMALEARPLQTLQTRIQSIDTRRAAFLDVSAQLLAIRNAVSNFHQSSFFRRFSATSSNESVLLPSAGEDAAPGTATIRVHSLVTNHAVVSRGFADAGRTPIGVGAITIESAAARVDRATDLDVLNGGRGVRRGVIRITDRGGASADIDLSRAFTVQDVLDAINTHAGIRVTASVTGLDTGSASGERIVLTDETGGAGNLTVADLNGGFAARDLGLAGSVAAARLDGTNLLRLDPTTTLASLNDGNGIDRLRQGATADDLIFTTGSGSFGVSLGDVLALDTDLRAVNGGNGVRLGVVRITDRNGDSADVDLTGATTVLNVKQAIEAAGLAVTVTTVNSRLQITATTPATLEDAEPLKIEDVSGHAAEDLGIAAEVNGQAISGRDIYRVATVGDLIRAINYAAGNDGQAQAALSADGKRIELSAAASAGVVTIAAGTDATGVTSHAASDLGILDAAFSAGQPLQTRRLIGGLNTALLQSLGGGAGVGTGMVALTDASGASATIDFSSAATLQDVIDLINAEETVSLSAEVNRAGNGIVIRDTSGGTGALTIADASGSLAADLNIAGTFAAGAGAAAESGNLQRQYISRGTLLADINGGRGIGTGTITVTSTNGSEHEVNIGGNLRTVGELINEMNLDLPDYLNARINDRGDGIIIEDTAGGESTLTIGDAQGQVAQALRLSGSARTGATFIDGSFEATIEVGPSDTLSRLAERLNAANAGLSASVINDGGTANPFSLTITSTLSGRRGAMIVDTGGLDLGFSTLTQAQDALASVGTGSGSASMLVASTSNTLEGILPGVSINLVSASDEDVTVTTTQDVDAIVEGVRGFVDKYNALQEKLDQYTSFNSGTFARGTLFGDATVDQVRRRLQRVIGQPFEGVDPGLSRLFGVGVRLGADNRLEFNEDRFRDAYEEAPERVEQLFNTAETGFGATLQETLDEMTRSADGLLARKDDALGDQKELLNDRIQQMNVLLAAKRARLEAQFAALETTLAALQDQQTSLTSLAQLAASAYA